MRGLPVDRRELPQWLLKTFLKGLLLVVPLTVTLAVFWFVFVKIDGLLGFSIPGLGFILTILIIIGVGALGSTLLVNRIVIDIEKAVGRVPMAKLIYFSLKDFVGAFVGEKKRFNRPAMVSIAGTGGEVKILGFVTADGLDIPGMENSVAVYLPQSYNFAGNLILVPRERVTLLPQGESSRWLTFIVSGGVSGGSDLTGNPVETQVPPK